MSSSFSSSLTPGRIALLSTGVLATAVISYALVFDYRRRNDPAFRRKLQKEQRKLQKTARAQADSQRQSVAASLRRAVALVDSEPLPVDVAGKEAYFMEHVGIGEQLAARGPENYVGSAISFFRALRVYPAPTDLITIYQKTQPPELFQYIMEMLTISMGGGAEGPSTPTRSRDPRDSTSDALLTEIVDTTPPVTSSPTSAASVVSDTSSGPPSTGSFVHVESETAAIVVEDPPESSV